MYYYCKLECNLGINLEMNNNNPFSFACTRLLTLSKTWSWPTCQNCQLARSCVPMDKGLHYDDNYKHSVDIMTLAIAIRVRLNKLRVINNVVFYN